VTYWIHPNAEAELGDAAAYYATHASKMVAEAFVAEFEHVLERVVENQAIGPSGAFGFRVCHFERFPYTLVYDESAEGPRVYAVAHQHREPGYWLSRA